MVATTIPNSGGPGSPNELSPITIAVRDKVIEKFQHEPLDQMNESVKKLLSQETDEQKRLGILAARVYILRQRIAMLSSQDQERVVSSSSPSPENTGATDGAEQDAGDEAPREWTRLRILEDCEVNGVRFPKTVIIDVKSEDAQRLIDSGNAELIEEQPQAEPAATEESDKDVAEVKAEAGDQTEEAVAEAAAEQQPEDAPAEDSDTAEQTEEEPQAAAPVEEEASSMESADEEPKETVIEAPSAAEVTAALAALSSDQEAPAEPAPPATNTSEAEDVAAALQALSGSDADSSAEADQASADDDAAAVAAELEAAAAAMSSGPASGDDAGDDDTKPGGWFEAQQNAEKAAKDKTGDEESGEDAPDAKS